MVSVCKLGGTINQTGVKGGKSKRSKIPPQSLSFSFSPRPRFSRFAAHRSPRDVRSIALKTLGKERDCSQSNCIQYTSTTWIIFDNPKSANFTFPLPSKRTFDPKSDKCRRFGSQQQNNIYSFAAILNHIPGYHRERWGK